MVVPQVSPQSAGPADTPTATTGKAQRAYEWIATEIRERRFAPGHRLVLTQLAEAIGVSVAPVREALRRLEAEGLITYQRNIGATVAMMNEGQYADVMDTLAVLEARAVALAVPHLDESTLARAHALNEELRVLVSSVDAFDPERFTLINRAFHETLYLACPNEYLCELVESGWSRLDALRESSFSFIPARATSSVTEHDGILAAIEADVDPSTVEQLARTHRLATLETFMTRARERRTEGGA